MISSEPGQSRVAVPRPEPERFRALAQLGFGVFPLLPRDKKPAVEWKDYQTRRATPKETEQWSTDPRGLNVAVVAGEISGGLAVLDLDGPEAREDLEKRYNALPITPTVRTNKGWHLYLRDLTGGLRNFAGKLTHVDLRGNGGFVVGAGSIHPSGALYSWEPGLSPNDVPFAPAPDWLIDLATQSRRTREPAPPWASRATHSTHWKPPRVQRYVDRALELAARTLGSASLGERNATLNAIAFSLGRLAAAGAVDVNMVSEMLLMACLTNGLIHDDGERSVRATIRSGLTAGLQEPQDLSHILRPRIFGRQCSASRRGLPR